MCERCVKCVIILFDIHLYLYIIQSEIIINRDILKKKYFLQFIISKRHFIRRCAFGFVDSEAKNAKRFYLLDRCRGIL